MRNEYFLREVLYSFVKFERFFREVNIEFREVIWVGDMNLVSIRI